MAVPTTSANACALFLIVQELRRREVGAANDSIGGVLEDDVDHPVRMRVGEGIEHDVADDAVDDGGGADAEAEGDNRRRR